MEKLYFDITNKGHSLTFRNNNIEFNSKPEVINFLKNNNINNFIGINKSNKYTNIFKFISLDKGFECFGFVIKKEYICNS